VNPNGKWSPEFAGFITEKLDLTWSPEQIVGRCFSGTLSFKTIYRRVYQGSLQRTAVVLRHKRKHQKLYEARGLFTVGTSIKQRPKEIRKRETFGHWEQDPIVPYSSWQRGSNENGNGLLREFYLKGTDFACIDPFELARTLALINERPRKCLQWRTTHEAFTHELLHLKG
jgi:transposase, IS30 family